MGQQGHGTHQVQPSASFARPQFFLAGEPHYGGASGISGPPAQHMHPPHFPLLPTDSIGGMPVSHNFKAAAFWLSKITPRPYFQFLSFPVSSPPPHPPSLAQVLICIFISMQSQPHAGLLNGPFPDFMPGWSPRRRRKVGMEASRLTGARWRTHSKSRNLKVRVRSGPSREKPHQPHHFLETLWPEH